MPAIFNLNLPGNSAADRIASLGMLPAPEAQYLATVALAFEQRTANLIAAQATPGWLDEVRGRLGHPTPPIKDFTTNRGRTPDPLPNPDLSTASIIEEAIIENLKRWMTDISTPGTLAIDGIIDLRELSGKIASALEKEGRLSA